MSFEAWSVAVKLNLQSNAAAIFGSLSQHIHKAEAEVGALNKKMMLLGGALAGGGIAGLGIIGKMIGASKDYAHELAQLNVLGMKHTEIQEVIKQSWQTSRDVVTTTAADNIKAYREMRAVFGAGHEHEALTILPMAQRAAAVLQSLTGKATAAHDVGYDLSKAAELTVRGAMSEDLLIKRTEQFTRASIAFGGKINPNDFHMALKYARGAGQNYSDDFIANYLPTLIQEQKTGHGGASSAGVMLRAFDTAVVGQKIPLNKLQNWIEAGAIDEKKIVWNKHHTGAKAIRPGAVVGQELASTNSYQWMQQYGNAAIERLMAKFHINDDQAMQALAGNQMLLSFLREMRRKAPQFERDKALIGKVDSGKDAYEKLLKTDPVLAHLALQKQWNNLLSILGYQIMPDVLKGTMWLIERFKEMSKWVKENEGKARALVLGFTALSAAMAIGGTLALLKFGFSGITGVLGVAGGAGLIGVLGKAGLAGAASFAIIEVGRLGFAIADLFSAKNRQGVGLTGDAAARLADPSIQRQLKAMDGDFKGLAPLPAGGMRATGTGTGTQFPLLPAGGTRLADSSIQRRLKTTDGNFKGFMPLSSEGMRATGTGAQIPDAASGMRATGAASRFPGAPPNRSEAINVQVLNKLDERGLTTAVTRTQGKWLARPATGPRTFDGSMTPIASIE